MWPIKPISQAVALLVATSSTPLEPQIARAPTAREETNIEVGSVQEEIGDYIPPVIGRDKPDLNTSAATTKVTTQNRSRSHQPDHANSRAGELVNPTKDELNIGRERAGSRKPRRVDSSSSLGDTPGQALSGTPIAAPIGAGKSRRGTSSSSVQATAQDAKQQIKSSSGNRGSRSNRSRSNQPDHAMVQVDELVNSVKDGWNTDWERAGSPKKSSTNSRSRNIDSSSSLRDTESQAPVGTPIAAPIGAGNSIHGTSSAYAQAVAQQQVKSSSVNRGSTTNRSRSNQSDHTIVQVDEVVNPAKDGQNTGRERGGSPKKSSRNSRSRNVDSSSSLGDTGSQAPVRTPIAAPIGTGKSIRRTKSASAQVVARQQVKSSGGRSTIIRSRSYQFDSPPSRNVDSSSSLGDTESRASVGTPITAPVGAGKSSRGTSSSVQAAAHDAKQQVKSSSANRGSTSNRSRSNQPDHVTVQVDELVNPVKEGRNTSWERAGSPKKSSGNSRSRNVDPSSSLSQAPVGTPIAAPIDVGNLIRGTSSAGAQAVAQQQVKSSSANRGSTTNRSRSNPSDSPPSRNVNSSSSLGDTESRASVGTPIAAPVGVGKSSRGTSVSAAHDAKQQIESSSGNRGLVTTNRSRSNQPDHSIVQVDELGNPAKDKQNTGWETAGSPKKSSTNSRSRNVDSSSSLSQAPLGTPIAAPIGAGNSIRGTSPAYAQAVAQQQQVKSSSGNRGSTADRSRSNQHDHSIVQVDELVNPTKDKQNTGWETAGSLRKPSTNSQLRNVDSSSNIENVNYSDDDVHEDARAATPRFQEALTQEALHRQFQKQQHAAHHQMYMQQQQLLEVAQALAPALQQANDSAMNMDHHYRKLWNHANAQLEELQKSQRQNHRLMGDNRSLTHELEAVKGQLADAKKLSEVLMVLAAPRTLSEVRGKELKVDTTDVDQKANEEESWDMPGGTDVLLTAAAIQMVDVLNAEVRRAVVALCKVLQKTKFEEGNRPIMHITEKARLMLGENMVHLLFAGLPEKTRLDPLLLQVVLQVAITNWCKTTISSWKPGNSDVSNLLVELYSKIREVEDPTFYRRWRSVTWAQLDFSPSSCSQDLLDGLLDILAFAGWPAPNADQKNLLEEQLPHIFSAVRDLRKALGKDITSIDIEVATIVPGMTFDSAFMDNGWPALTKGSTLEIVSGTTGLGLKKVIVKPSTEGVSPVPHVDIIYRPVVILESTVKGALVPQKRSGFGRW